MALSFDQAVSQLASLHSTGNLNATSLRELISALDVSASGSITVLYSGTANDVSATDIASGLKNDSGVRIIDKTAAAKFLDLNQNPALAAALEEVVGGDPTLRGTAANAFLFGTMENGARVPNGAWDIVSGKFLDATTGPVKILTETYREDSVFMQTELPKLLTKLQSGSDITEISRIKGVRDILFSETLNMPRRPRVLLADYPLHIVQRGINREPCFFTDEDYYCYLHWLEAHLWQINRILDFEENGIGKDEWAKAGNVSNPFGRHPRRRDGRRRAGWTMVVGEPGIEGVRAARQGVTAASEKWPFFCR